MPGLAAVDGIRRRKRGNYRLGFDLGTAAYADAVPPMPRAQREECDVFFVALFNSLNRLHGLLALKAHFDTIGWLVNAIDHTPIIGFEDWMADPEVAREAETARLVGERGRLRREHAGLFSATQMGKRIFAAPARRSRVIPALSGIRELGYRHYQVFEWAKPLICEDLEHVETIFPFRHGHNVLYVQDRPEDLGDVVRQLLQNDALRREIAENGARVLRASYADGDRIFSEYFLQHLRLASSAPGAQ
jgi:Glycosyl transferases group 1